MSVLSYEAVGLVAIMLVSVSPAAAARNPGCQALTVRLDSLLPLPAAGIRAAEQRAASVFDRIGVRLRWIDADQAYEERVGPMLTLVLANARRTDGFSTGLLEALGVALPDTQRAYVFHDRIVPLQERSGRSPFNLLGDVLAHELGHLLLPGVPHSLDGIMRASLDVRSSAVRTFARQQEESVVKHVRALCGANPT